MRWMMITIISHQWEWCKYDYVYRFGYGMKTEPNAIGWGSGGGAEWGVVG